MATMRRVGRALRAGVCVDGGRFPSPQAAPHPAATVTTRAKLLSRAAGIVIDAARIHITGETRSAQRCARAVGHHSTHDLTPRVCAGSLLHPRSPARTRPKTSRNFATYGN